MSRETTEVRGAPVAHAEVTVPFVPTTSDTFFIDSDYAGFVVRR